MNQNIINDFHVIYPQLPQSQMLKLIEHLDNIVKPNSNILRIRTRNEKNNILSYQGQCYFSLVHKLKRPVVVAGAMDYNLSRNLVSAIRFRNNNIAIGSIPDIFKFPYRKPNWTYVEIREDTVNYFYTLLAADVIYYLCHLTRRSS